MSFRPRSNHLSKAGVETLVQMYDEDDEAPTKRVPSKDHKHNHGTCDNSDHEEKNTSKEGKKKPDGTKGKGGEQCDDTKDRDAGKRGGKSHGQKNNRYQHHKHYNDSESKSTNKTVGDKGHGKASEKKPEESDGSDSESSTTRGKKGHGDGGRRRHKHWEDSDSNSTGAENERGSKSGKGSDRKPTPQQTTMEKVDELGRTEEAAERGEVMVEEAGSMATMVKPSKRKARVVGRTAKTARTAEAKGKEVEKGTARTARLALDHLASSPPDCSRSRRSEWKPDTTYQEGDEVTYEGKEYVCVEDHTSRPTWVPPKVVNLWEPTEASPESGSGNEKPLILPYASELFGVYQPLMGWKSELSHETLSNAVKRRVQEAARHASKLTRPEVPRIMAVDRTGSQIGRALAAHVSQRNASVNDLLSDNADSEFKNVVRNIMSRSLRAGETQAGEGPIFDPPSIPAQRPDEIAMAAVLRQLNTNAPAAVKQLFRPSVSKLDRAIGAASFFAGDHPANDVYLLPIGLLHQFREYFFQLGTFLGPPVGHVWISPGGSVELVEVNTRRRLVEQTMEEMINTVTKSETTATDKDELSDAVKDENANDMKLGASATASGGIGPVFQASGTASFNLDTSRKQAQEQIHKKIREQSAKLTSEVTRNYKTTFRTVTETTDTSSRRYVLQNKTNRLVSYELSCKMRKVGVQVQDLGQRLCFQMFVENPGDPLGVGEFVHSTAAALDPAIKIPEEQDPPPPKLVTVSDNFPYVVTSGDKVLDGDFYPDPENWTGGFHDSAGDNDRIDFRREYKLPPGPDGYDLSNIKHLDFKGANVKVKPDFKLNVTEGTYVIHLDYANFNNKETLPFDLQVEYVPDDATKARVQKKNDENEKAYEDQLAAAKKSFYDTLRTRLKLISQVRPRSGDVLREEERHVIYQRIIHRLYGDESGFRPEDYYAAAEMIRYFFDIDALLYFVAPDWWKPRTIVLAPRDSEGRPTSTALSPTPLSTRAVLHGKDVDAQLTARSTYLMTDETEPAPLGASLGWLMQLDGDTHRNAFLNSPWVKAILPIRPGRERDALAFLQRQEVAGAEGLDNPYSYDEDHDPPSYKDQTLKQVLLQIADRIADEYERSLKPKPIGKSKDGEGGGALKKPKKALPTEMVFAHGFDPLEGGIDFGKGAFKVFSEWTEILPTDQVVATEYDLKGL